MIGHIVLALLAAAPCPPQAPVELEGRALGAVRLACTSWLLTDSGLARVGPEGVQQVLEQRLVAGLMRLDPVHERLLVRTEVHGDDGIRVTIRAWKANTLAVDSSWGARGELNFVARRKKLTPHSSAGGHSNFAVRPDGSLLVLTRADTFGAQESVIQSWAVSPEGVSSEPTTLLELASSTSGEVPALALADDGRALYATIFMGTGRGDLQQGMHLFGLTAAGKLDPSFGEGGHAIDRTMLYVHEVAWSNGGWLVAGSDAHSYAVVAARFEKNGTLDASYAKLGHLRVPSVVGALEWTRTMLVLPNGRALITGARFWKTDKRSRPMLVSVSPSGVQESVEQLELADDATVEGVTLLTAPGESQLLFGFRGASTAGAKLTTFLRDLKYSPAVSKPSIKPEPVAEPATMYRWVGPDGVEGFATSLDEVPPKFRKLAKPWDAGGQ